MVLALLACVAAVDDPFVDGTLPESGWTNGIYSFAAHADGAGEISDGCKMGVFLDPPLTLGGGSFAWTGMTNENGSGNEAAPVDVTGELTEERIHLVIALQSDGEAFVDEELDRDDTVTEVEMCGTE
jgi:hypothetical protein